MPGKLDSGEALTVSPDKPYDGSSVGFRLLLLNARGLTKHDGSNNITADVKSHNPNIAIITETWFKHEYDDNLYNIPGYSLYRRDRVKRKGGGVAMFVTSPLNCEVCNVNLSATYETLMIVVNSKTNGNVKSNMYLIVAVYHPPNPPYDSNKFIDELSESISHLLNKYPSCDLIIAGDFNQLDIDSLCASTGTVSVPSPPTRGTNTLDRFLVTNVDSFHAETYSAITRTDHSLVMCYSYEDNSTRSLNTKIIKRIVHPQPTAPQLQSILVYMSTLKSINSCGSDKNTNTIYNELREHWLSIINYFVPPKKIRLRRGGIIADNIQRLLHKRNRHLRRGHSEQANTLTIKIRKLLIRRKEKMIINCGDNPSKLWKVVNSFKSNFIYNDDTNRVSAVIKTADDLERLYKHFANISTCEGEQLTSPSYHHSCGNELNDNAQFTTNEVAAILSAVKKTSCCDNVPW